MLVCSMDYPYLLLFRAADLLRRLCPALSVIPGVTSTTNSGLGIQARQMLEKALQAFPRVPAYLTGIRRITVSNTTSITVDGEEEAMQYAPHHLNHWRKTKGAVAWLESYTN
ncbi:MAG: hypothetical protein ACYCZF_02075 [Anaerolineae bacterium]